MKDNLTEELCGIYCIENTINEKKYIGMSRNIKRRWNEHKSYLNNHTHANQYLQSAWIKYGETNFNFYVLELCEEKNLSERECHYIKLYKSMSHQNGYNLTPGGENTSIGKVVICLKDKSTYNFVHEAASSANVSSATMSIWCKQKRNYMYLEEFDELSSEEKDYWINFNWEEYDHVRLGKAHSRENLSKETLEKYKQALTGENNPRATKVYCPQLDEAFDCIKYASDKYRVNRGSITSCLKGRLKSAGKHPVTGEKLTWEKIEK